jgi:hypothetical protein
VHPHIPLSLHTQAHYGRANLAHKRASSKALSSSKRPTGRTRPTRPLHGPQNSWGGSPGVGVGAVHTLSMPLPAQVRSQGAAPSQQPGHTTAQHSTAWHSTWPQQAVLSKCKQHLRDRHNIAQVNWIEEQTAHSTHAMESHHLSRKAIRRMPKLPILLARRYLSSSQLTRSAASCASGDSRRTATSVQVKPCTWA